MLHIGCHLSISKGFCAMGHQALALNADTFQFFTRNPRGGAAKEPRPADVEALCALLTKYAFAPIIAHAPYTLNPCAADPAIRDFAARVLVEDIARLNALPATLYNLHPGAHVGQGKATGIALTATQLASALHTATSTVVLLETMAGKGSELGGTFEELTNILDAVEQQGIAPHTLGVCLDTCHVHDAGYDIVNDLDGVLVHFDKTIGLDRLHAMHLNDSLNPLGSRKDRHAKIGQGHIGLEAFARIVNHPALCDLPFCLETPNELDGYAQEIALLRSLTQ